VEQRQLPRGVDRGGHPIAGSERVVAPDLRDPVVASNGTTTLIVAHTNFVQNEVDVLALDAAGNVVRRTTIWNYAGALYAAAARDGGFTVALTDPSGLFAFRYDATGTPLGGSIAVMRPSGSPLASHPVSVALASRGSETLIVWTTYGFQRPYDLFATILSADGVAGPRVALPHGEPYSGSYLVGIDAIADDGGYTLLFSGPPPDATKDVLGPLLSLRLNADATPASQPQRVTAGAASAETTPRLARAGAGYGIVWIAGNDRVEGAVAPAPTGVQPRLLSRSATEQSGPSIASNGSGYLTAWLEQSADHDSIYAEALDHNGVPAGPPLLLFDRAAPSYPRPPRVAFSSGTYLVAWIGDGGVQAMRFDGAGRPLDAQPLPLSGPLNLDQQFDVTPTPAGFFIVWTQGGWIYGAALTGPLPSTPQRLTEHLPAPPQVNGPFESQPHVAFNGEKFLLAYASTFLYPCADIPCTSVTKWELVRLDASGRRETEPRELDQQPLDVASDGHDFALAGWNELLRIDAQTLAVTARLPVPSDSAPALLWNGTHYVAVMTLHAGDGGATVVAREITPAWTFGTTRSTTIVPRFAFSFDAATNAAGDVVVAYARIITGEPFDGAPRVAVQVVGDVAPARRPVARRP
jgi:hypothetical protein